MGVDEVRRVPVGAVAGDTTGPGRCVRGVVEHRTPSRPKRLRPAAVPHALLHLAGFVLLRPLVRVRLGPGAALPPRALVYGFHEVLLAGVLASRFTRHVVWVGNDTIGGVASSVPVRAAGTRVFRLATRSPVPQWVQLNAFLAATDVPVGILTDAGRGDRQVRRSLARMAVATRRPLVPMAVTSTRAGRLDGHVYPLPFATVTVRYGAPVPPETLAGMPPDAARALLTQRLRAVERTT